MKYTDFLLSTCVHSQNGENSCQLGYEFELDQSQHKLSEFHASGWLNQTEVERKYNTCVQLRISFEWPDLFLFWLSFFFFFLIAFSFPIFLLLFFFFLVFFDFPCFFDLLLFSRFPDFSLLLHLWKIRWKKFHRIAMNFRGEL